MPDRELPARPSLEQYKKQAKDLVSDCARGGRGGVGRLQWHHPRFHQLQMAEIQGQDVKRTDAQLVLAREHGFESWPKFAKHIQLVNLIDSVASIDDPVAAFIEVACVPRHTGHASGTLDHAETILARYPHVARASIHTAAILGDQDAVREFLARDPKSATATGGPHGWDALTYLCFSRYLRIDKARSDAFVRTARALLDGGASAQTGWVEMIDHPNPRPTFESAIYGAAGIARHAELTRLLLERGADPNDEETPYHVPEGYDNNVLRILLESGRLNETSLTWILGRKADWHDEQGLRLALEYGANPNIVTHWGDSALDHALRRDNGPEAIAALLDYGADPRVKSRHDGRSAVALAAHRGRADVLALFEQRGIVQELEGLARLLAACARGDRKSIATITAREPELSAQVIAVGGTTLAEFAGNGNVEGLRCLLDLGIGPTSLYSEGDLYFDIAKNSTALHVAAWRARHAAVKELIARGAPVNARDGSGRTALALAVKACVDSYWKNQRSPESVEALLAAGATLDGVKIPSGYDEVDALLR
jgi:ankyrin repeat protein